VFKYFCGYSRRHSVLQMLLELSILCFDTIIIISRIKFDSVFNSLFCFLSVLSLVVLSVRFSVFVLLPCCLI